MRSNYLTGKWFSLGVIIICAYASLGGAFLYPGLAIAVSSVDMNSTSTDGHSPEDTTGIQRIELVPMSESEIRGVSLLTIYPGIQLTGEYLGIIGEEGPPNQFALYSSDGSELFSLTSPSTAPFYRAVVREGLNRICLTAAIDEGVYQAFVYNLSGQLIFCSDYLDSPLEPSPGGCYFYTTYNFMFGAVPQIYDNYGTLIGQPEVQSEFWQLSARSDSQLIFQDGNIVRIISVPGMAPVREFAVESVEPPVQAFRTAVSASGQYYAFGCKTNTAVCDLLSGEVSLISRDEIDGVSKTPGITLSPNGNLLISYDPTGTVLTINERDPGTLSYRKIVNEFRVNTGNANSWLKAVEFTGKYAILVYYIRDESISFKSFIFDYRQPSSSLSAGKLVEGLAAPGAAPDAITVFRYDNQSRGSAKLGNYKLEAVLHE